MDRNDGLIQAVDLLLVALRKESVDRNAGGFPTIKAMRGSLSARRAWIEIFWRCAKMDANTSLSARRAWIEITQFVPITTSDVCRSPQGERG